ncbi:mobile mystery protein B [Ekhidna sp.]|jgi:Fic-DOC domain mobile mystery protein B|uniref:mobile mystery protein B n=1 Tax=Ekhidna sp. TaxID=2608089 RepID=UPI0032EFCF46|tara:strand:+ start:800 stop:1399 length:600 start_codon:yes stop_codon:yes gene_type:complete
MDDQLIFSEPEGATPLDPDEIEGLLLSHIQTKAELNRWEQDNINQAYTWLERRRNKKDVISEEFVFKLHEKMFDKVWRWAGNTRLSDRNIGVDYPRIRIELAQLLGDVQYWVANETYPPDEIAARFHHKLVWIHIFPNGNGRHSRLAADTLLVDVLGQEPFSWGDGDLYKDGEIRQIYIAALRAADQHDYDPLLAFVRS